MNLGKSARDNTFGRWTEPSKELCSFIGSGFDEVVGLGLLAGCLVVLLEDEDALDFLGAIETDFGARTKKKMRV